MSSSDDRDVLLYRMVHELLQAMRQPDRERRRHQRCDYSGRLLAAPYRDGVRPSVTQFRQLPCRDLSARGFSYLADAAPDYEQLIVAMGDVPFTFLLARVIHSTEVFSDGKSRWLTGCRFAQRLTELRQTGA